MPKTVRITVSHKACATLDVYDIYCQQLANFFLYASLNIYKTVFLFSFSECIFATLKDVAYLITYSYFLNTT